MATGTNSITLSGMTPDIRRRIERLVEALISALDAADGDTDLEDGHDRELDWGDFGIGDHDGLHDVEQEIQFRRQFAQHREAKRGTIRAQTHATD